MGFPWPGPPPVASPLPVHNCYGYISPGLPVGAAHLFSREMLTRAARPASDSSEVDHVTTPSQRQAGSARFVSRLSEPL